MLNKNRQFALTLVSITISLLFLEAFLLKVFMLSETSGTQVGPTHGKDTQLIMQQCDAKGDDSIVLSELQGTSRRGEDARSNASNR